MSRFGADRYPRLMLAVSTRDGIRYGKGRGGAMDFKPVTPDSWPELAKFFAGRGNPNYCWCMIWRATSTEYRRMKGAERKAALQQRVASGESIGLLAYQDGEPVAWCSVAPRGSYKRLERSRTIKPVDDRDCWSIVCFFVAPAWRGRGLTTRLLRAAVEYACEQGAEVVEGYPVEPERDEEGNWQPAKSYRFMGYLSSFEKAGFVDVTPADSSRRVMRFEIAGKAAS